MKHQPLPKRRRAARPAHQQLVGGEIWMSKNGELEWSSCPRNEPLHMAANVITMQPGAAWMAVSRAGYCFVLNFSSQIPFRALFWIVLIVKGGMFLEKVEGDGPSQFTELLWGSYPCWSFQVQWGIHRFLNAETGRDLLYSTVSLENFHIISRTLSLITGMKDQLDGRETSLLPSGHCGTSGCITSPCFTTLGPVPYRERESCGTL